MHTRRSFKPGNFALRVARSNTGKGVFADSRIPKGACVIEYIGRPATKAEQDANTGKYLFWTSNTTMINGNITANKARFINHSCRPNCEVDQKGRRIFIFAARNITVGEELTYDYDTEYFEMYLSDGRCRCTWCIAKRP